VIGAREPPGEPVPARGGDRMIKADGKWCIDLAATIKKERDADGAQAFQVWKYVDKPAQP